MTPEQRDELLALLDGSMPIAAAWNVVESLSRMKASARFRFASALQGTVRRSYHPRGRRPTATQGELLRHIDAFGPQHVAHSGFKLGTFTTCARRGWVVKRGTTWDLTPAGRAALALLSVKRSPRRRPPRNPPHVKIQRPAVHGRAPVLGTGLARVLDPDAVAVLSEAES